MKKTVRPDMFIIMLGTWMILSVVFISRYFQIASIESLLFDFIVLIWILLSLFYSIFHMISFLFSFFIRLKGESVSYNYKNTPPVAILYTCMNDMKEKSITTCLNQDYPNYTLYILDDSTLLNERKSVDALSDKYEKSINIIRRKSRDGFKAGNLNNALKQIGDRFKYICVLDADEQIHPKFLRQMVAIAEANEEFGFVQASHQQYGETEYGKQTGHGIDLHWNYFLPARNKFGFICFYGHGALLQLKAVKSIGGFPEIVSEDIALSAKMREAGYRGYYAHNIKCFEETPPSYEAFRRRNQKIVSGTLEFLISYYPFFFQSKNVSFIEKIDLLISSSIIYLPVPFMLFIFFLHFFSPLLSDCLSTDIKNVSILYFFDSWDVKIFVLLTIFAPLCYLIPNAVRSPLKMGLYVFRMGTIYLSVCLQTIKVTIDWFVNRKASFTPTGDCSQKKVNIFSTLIEPLIGLILITAGALYVSPCLMAVGLSLMLVPILIGRNLNRFLQILFILPFCLTIMAVYSSSNLYVGMTGIFAGVAFANHW